MSDTPETNNLARGNHVVPTEWAEQLERERDCAKNELHRLTGKLGDMWEANMAIGRERDNALALAEERKGYWDDSVKEYEELRASLPMKTTKYPISQDLDRLLEIYSRLSLEEKANERFVNLLQSLICECKGISKKNEWAFAQHKEVAK